MLRRPTRSNRTYSCFPFTTLFRSGDEGLLEPRGRGRQGFRRWPGADGRCGSARRRRLSEDRGPAEGHDLGGRLQGVPKPDRGRALSPRSEEHTSELQSLMRIAYADFCLKKKKTH